MARKKTILSTDINVVPYIDVMLVLLIIFMITAPLLEQGVDVELPSTENNSQVELSSKSSIFLVSIDSNGDIHASFNDNTVLVSEDDLYNSAKDFLKVNNDSKVFLRADKNIKYENVINTMDLLKSAGYKNVGLISKSK